MVIGYRTFRFNKKVNPDDAIRQLIVGPWIREEADCEGTNAINSDGGFKEIISELKNNSNNTKIWIYEGTWRISDGVLILTLTNVIGSDPHEPVGNVEYVKIIHLDEYELVAQENSETFTYKRAK